MAEIIIEDKAYLNPALGETVGTEWLIDNIGSVVNFKLTFRFETLYITSTDVIGDGGTVFFAPDGNDTGYLSDLKMLWSDDPTAFEEINQGDQITVSGATTAGNDTERTVILKMDDQTLIMDVDFTKEVLPIGRVVQVSTKMTGFEYLDGLIENSEPINFTSKIDGSTQRAIVTGVDNTDLITKHYLSRLGNKSYQYNGGDPQGSIYIQGNNKGLAAGGFAQGFILTQSILITPLFLASQLTDFKNGKFPPYFIKGNSLKHVFSIEGSANITDPNRKKSVASGDKLGNVGYVGENFNDGPTKYSIQGLTYKRLDNTINPALELVTTDTVMEFYVLHSLGNVFSDGNTRMIITHHFAPVPEDEYKEPQFPVVGGSPNLAKDRYLEENFIHDRIECVMGTQSTIAQNTGKTYSVIKDCLVEFVSATLAKVTTTFALHPDILARLGPLSKRNYRVMCETKDYTLARIDGLNDAVQLEVDVNQYYTDFSDPGLITQDLKFLEHPKSDIDADSITALTARVDDDVLAIADIDLDLLTREGDDIIINSIEGKIIAKNQSDPSNIREFNLDSFDVDTSGALIVTDATFGGVPNISFVQDRGFKTPTDNNRKNIDILRRFDLDAGGKFRYQFQFPFICRWEEWEQNQNRDTVFFDPTEDNDGLNEEWYRYGSLLNWNLFFVSVVNLTKNGNPLTFTEERSFNLEDYLQGTEWDNENMESKDGSGTPILLGANYGLITGADTTIEANKTFNTTPLPTLGDLEAQMRINVYLKGNYLSTYTISSVRDRQLNSWLKSIGITNRVVITDEGAGVFRASCIVDGSLLPDELEFRMSCTFYDLRPDLGIPDGKEISGGGLKETSEGTGIKNISS
jgi:hypothetical protein